MSIKYQAQAIDDQMARLKLLFPEDYAYITVEIEKMPDNRVNYTYKAGADFSLLLAHTTGVICETPKAAVDSLLSRMRITSVQQYLMKNHHRFGEKA